jgi:hypothetical protein
MVELDTAAHIMSSPHASSHKVELHGWDAAEAAWHGPHEFDCRPEGCRGILSKLRELPGSWYGRMRTRVAGGPELSFRACMYDLGDAGLAVLDLEGSAGGPLLNSLVVPEQRRERVRPELAFEYVSYLRFLEGPSGAGSELAMHDYIERALRESDRQKSLVFAVESRFIEPETHIAICEQSARLSTCLLAWLSEKDTETAATDGGSFSRLCA